MADPTAAAPTGVIPPFSFTAPEGLYALPLAPSEEQRTVRAEAFVRDLYSEGDEGLWEQAAPFYAAMGEFLTESGLSFSAVGLFSTDEGGVAQCALTVALVETDQRDPEVAARGVLGILSDDEHNDARWLDLPCGPAVSCITLREIPLPPEVTADGEETKLLTGQIQVHVPFSTGPFTAVLTLQTASMDYWGEFCDMTAAVLQTVSFADPATEEP